MNTKLIKELRGLADGSIEPKILNQGICDNIYEKFGDDSEEMCISLFPAWPLFSRNYIYPIPCPKLNPHSAYLAKDNKWADDEYGNNRRALCAWLADKLEEL